jgi:sugar-specific transcriptional regulator TrmB
MIPTLKEALQSLGLHEKQERVLMILLQSGSMLASRVAKEAKLNRTTTYGVLKELIEKGLASETKKGAVTRFQSISPDTLPAYLEKRQERLEESKKKIQDLLPQIKLLRDRGRTLPKVQYFEGEEGVRQAYEDTLENNSQKHLRNITGVDAVFKRLGSEWITYYLKKRTRLGIKCQNLAPESEWAKKSRADDDKYLRKTKLLPAQYMFDAEIDMYDDKVGIFSYSQENPIAVIIEDATISHAMRQIFDCLESNAK